MKYALKIFILPFVFSGKIMIAQCDPSLIPSKEVPMLAYRERGMRCEGFFEAPSSSPDKLFLVGLSIGAVTYSNREPENLIISAARHTNFEVQVRAVGIPNGLYYRMDASLMPGTKLTWPTQEILLKHPQTRDFRNVGIYGYKRTNGITYYLPIKLSTQSQNSNTISIAFTSRATIGWVEWEVHRKGDLIASGENDYIGGVPPGKSLSFYLPNSLSGTYLLSLKSQNYYTGEWLPIVEYWLQL